MPVSHRPNPPRTRAEPHPVAPTPPHPIRRGPSSEHRRPLRPAPAPTPITTRAHPHQRPPLHRSAFAHINHPHAPRPPPRPDQPPPAPASTDVRRYFDERPRLPRPPPALGSGDPHRRPFSIADLDNAAKAW